MEHTQPATTADSFKPRIDAAFQRMAEVAGADARKVQGTLDALDARELGAWHYLQAAARTLKPMLWNERLRGKLGDSWACALFEAGEGYPYACVEQEHEADPESVHEHPLVLSNYPEEAREALRQDHYWGGSEDDGQVVGVWETGGEVRLYHASPTSFRILANSPVEYIERVVRERLGER